MNRSEVRLSCPCRLSGGPTLDLELLDVSPRGCRVRVESLPLYVGQSMTVFPEGIEEFTATVRRADPEFAGIEFDQELPHAVYERIRLHGALDTAGDVHDEPATPAVEAETAEESRAGEASNDTDQRAGFGSLTSIAVERRRHRSFGRKAVVLR